MCFREQLAFRVRLDRWNIHENPRRQLCGWIWLIKINYRRLHHNSRHNSKHECDDVTANHSHSIVTDLSLFSFVFLLFRLISTRNWSPLGISSCWSTSMLRGEFKIGFSLIFFWIVALWNFTSLGLKFWVAVNSQTGEIESSRFRNIFGCLRSR